MKVQYNDFKKSLDRIIDKVQNDQEYKWDVTTINNFIQNQIDDHTGKQKQIDDLKCDIQWYENQLQDMQQYREIYNQIRSRIRYFNQNSKEWTNQQVINLFDTICEIVHITMPKELANLLNTIAEKLT